MIRERERERELSFGSLFAGIGGVDLGLERAGLRCKWQVEIDPFCREILRLQWPAVKQHDDVKAFPPEPIDDWTVDLIAGGFPCQLAVGSSGRLRCIPDSRICRVVDGLPDRLDRYRVLGNAVVPQVAQWIGQLI